LAYWYVVGFVSSVITLHITTLLLLDTPSLPKAAAVAAAFWLVCALFGALHLSSLLWVVTSLTVGCVLVKRLYAVSAGMALMVFFAHAFVQLGIVLVLWFVFHIKPGRPSQADRVDSTSTAAVAASDHVARRSACD
jgi:hypothetical protein